MFAILPLRVDVPLAQRPWANYAIIAACILAFACQLAVPERHWRFLLLGESPLGLLGHMWLHAGVFHLLGNMLFLWVFGNAVCAKLGNERYLATYVALGLVAGLVQWPFLDVPALGASGAINGIVGLYTVLYFQNEIECFAVFLFVVYLRIWRFSCQSLWIIALWVGLDFLGVVMGGGGVAYLAHLGGFAAGFALAFWLVVRGRIAMERHEKSLPAYLGWIGNAPGPSNGHAVRRPQPRERLQWFEPPDEP